MQKNATKDTDFLPLTSVSVKVDILDSIAHISMTQLYENPPYNPQDDKSEDKPIDMTFKFPREKNVVISRMAITIDDSKTIEAKVCEEEVGNDLMEDAMAGGNFAAMVKDSRENVDLH